MAAVVVLVAVAADLVLVVAVALSVVRLVLPVVVASLPLASVLVAHSGAVRGAAPSRTSGGFR
jgi:hypothetical protein